MKRFLKILMVVQVISALAVWPLWDSSDDSIAAYAIGGIWLLANLPGIILAILAIPLFVLASPGMVQADVFDGFLGYSALIGGPTGLSVILSLYLIRVLRRRMNPDFKNGEQDVPPNA